jgi:hypothetical protein
LIGNNQGLPYGEVDAMSFTENLKAGIKADRLLRKLVSTIKEPPGKWWVVKVLSQGLLDMTDLSKRSSGLTDLAGEKIRTLPTKAPRNGAPIGGLKVAAESG